MRLVPRHILRSELNPVHPHVYFGLLYFVSVFAVATLPFGVVNGLIAAGLLEEDKLK